MTLVGWLLVSGFVTFMLGAGGWRAEYEQPLEESLPVMHADRRRMRWIHRWMVLALPLTVAGLGGLAHLANDPGAAVAAAGYTAGAVLWIGSLVFRLSVGEWAAEQTAATGEVPDVYPALARWAGYGHLVHMVSAYATAIPLAWAAEGAGLISGWLAWAGSIWGLALLGLFAVPRTRFIASPPFWAHTFTFAVGLSMLL